MFISELFGAILQLMLFSLIPIIWWLITARKKESFFKWIGLKKVHFTGKVFYLLLITLVVVGVYGLLTNIFLTKYVGEVTASGSRFNGMGYTAIPTVLVYAFIRTGLAEEILFRGFIGKRFSNKFGFAVGNTVQALLFGALHGVPFGFATHNLIVTVCLTLLPAGFGWFNGWLDEKRSSGSIVSSWLLHGMINAVVGCMAL